MNLVVVLIMLQGVGATAWLPQNAFCNVTFIPLTLEEIPEGETDNATAMFRCFPSQTVGVAYRSADDFIASTEGNVTLFADESTALQIYVEGKNFGRTTILFEISGFLTKVEYEVSVVRKSGILEIIFAVALGLQIIVYNFSFGCKIDMHHVLAILKRPVAPFIGFCCQFVFMAPVSIHLLYISHRNTIITF